MRILFCRPDSPQELDDRFELEADAADELGVRHDTIAMEDVVDDFYEDAEIRKLRKKQVKHARFANIVKRIVGELSTVYIEPAPRSVGGTPTVSKYTRRRNAASSTTGASARSRSR